MTSPFFLLKEKKLAPQMFKTSTPLKVNKQNREHEATEKISQINQLYVKTITNNHMIY